jgi:hypothetical protein
MVLAYGFCFSLGTKTASFPTAIRLCGVFAGQALIGSKRAKMHQIAPKTLFIWLPIGYLGFSLLEI